jgi:hypothetical protein
MVLPYNAGFVHKNNVAFKVWFKCPLKIMFKLKITMEPFIYTNGVNYGKV